MQIDNRDSEDSVPGTAFDGTGQTGAEQAFPESESRFRSFFEQSGEAFLVLDGGRFIDCNAAAVRMLECDGKQGIVPRELAELSPKLQPDGTPSVEKARDLIARTFAEGSQRFEWLHLKADGSELPVEVSLTPMSLGGKWVMHVIWRDISERKQVEFRERTRLAILEKMASGAALPSLLDAIVTFVEQNSPGALCSILVANDDCTRLHHGAAPSLPDFYNAAVNGLRIKEGKGSCGTAAFLKKRVIVEDITGHSYWKGFEPAVQVGLRSCWSEPVLSPEGELLGTFATYHREPRAPSSNEIALIESAAHLAGIAISWARDNERRNALEGHVRQMQKMEAVGQLAGGIAHDFNNLLTPIMGYAEIIRAILGEGHTCQPKIDRIIAATMKSRDLVQKLLSLSRKQNLAMANLDLNRVIESFKDIIRHTIRANISCHIRLAPDGAQILADQGQMEQVLLNLALNARDAMPQGGRLSIATRASSVDGPQGDSLPGVLLVVSDTGQGMAPEVVRRIFEPFYTTKEVGRGTGLGLSTVDGIVAQSGGTIGVESVADEGTTFRIWLPAAEPNAVQTTAEPAQPTAAPPQPTTADEAVSGTVLVVEDDELTRGVVVRSLSRAGLQVLLAGDVDEAVRAVEQHEGPISLLLCDVVLPKASGPAVAEAVTRLRPGLPVLFMSGYTADALDAPSNAAGELPLIEKPFSPAALVARVTSLLTQARAPR